MAYPFSSNVPDVFLQHKDVIVYHCFNGDEFGAAHETYEFSLNTTCGNRGCTCPTKRCLFHFDVRTLPNYKELPTPLSIYDHGFLSEWNRNAWQAYYSSEPLYHEELIRAAIDLGYLTTQGVTFTRRLAKNVQ